MHNGMMYESNVYLLSIFILFQNKTVTFTVTE